MSVAGINSCSLSFLAFGLVWPVVRPPRPPSTLSRPTACPRFLRYVLHTTTARVWQASLRPCPVRTALLLPQSLFRLARSQGPACQSTFVPPTLPPSPALPGSPLSSALAGSPPAACRSRFAVALARAPPLSPFLSSYPPPRIPPLPLNGPGTVCKQAPQCRPATGACQAVEQQAAGGCGMLGTRPGASNGRADQSLFAHPQSAPERSCCSERPRARPRPALPFNARLPALGNLPGIPQPPLVLRLWVGVAQARKLTIHLRGSVWEPSYQATMLYPRDCIEVFGSRQPLSGLALTGASSTQPSASRSVKKRTLSLQAGRGGTA